MRHAKLQKVVLAALFAALTYVATNLIHIPTPGTNGYVNLGDCMVLLGAFLLGPVYGAAAGGIGSMLADLLLGYMSYAPFTLLIKGLMGLTAALLFRAAEKKTGTTVAAVTAGLAAECLMVLGYFAVESTALRAMAWLLWPVCLAMRFRASWVLPWAQRSIRPSLMSR